MNTRQIAAAAHLRPRQWLGLLIVAGGLLASVDLLWRLWAQLPPPVAAAGQAGGIAALATALGTLPVLLALRTSARARSALLGLGAGVMLAASAFSLTLPAIEAAQQQGATRWNAALMVGTGIVIGAAFLLLLEGWVQRRQASPLAAADPPDRDARLTLDRAWLFAFAVSLHNFPEGLAIGVAYAGDDAAGAAALATGIAVQDVPEGLVIALALRTAGLGRAMSVGMGALSGLVEPLCAVLGAAVVGVSAQWLPWGMAFAAGSMLCVISHSMIPECHRSGHERSASAGLILGFVLMMVLDLALAPS